jgi:hypothetical protein
MAAIDFSPKSILNKKRDIARMINVGMGEEKTLYFCGIQGERCPVAESKFLQALKETTIHKDFLPLCIE